jgi:cytochrome c-type biogenesis protein CcmH/NrfG
MGWFLLILFAAITGLGLWKLGNMPRAALELVGAALLLGVAGYALQGSPALVGHPVEAAESAPLPAQDAAMVKSMSGMSAEGQWLDLADALVRSGHTRSAVSIIQGGIAKSPNNPDLWVGLGNALVVHNSGMMNPAAQFAFEKAAKLSPNHPGPPFFLGMALAQSGKFDQAGEVWRGLLARAPEGASWKADLEARLKEINQLPQTASPALPPRPGGESAPQKR